MINIYKKLNDAIRELEKDIFEEPDIKKIDRILELSTNNSNAIFELLTGYTIKEYLRKRRLSEAVFLIQKERIIDVAITCGYDTREGFSRAFRGFHGVNPSKCIDRFNYLPPIQFEEKFFNYNAESFYFKKFPQIKLYAINVTLSQNELEKEAKMFKSKCIKRYGGDYFCIFQVKNNKFLYYFAKIEPFCRENIELCLPENSFTNFNKNSQILPDLEISKNEKVELLYKI